jgi:hypothetical protein
MFYTREGVSTGTCEITYSNREDAEAAATLNGVMADGKQLSIQIKSIPSVQKPAEERNEKRR